MASIGLILSDPTLYKTIRPGTVKYRGVSFYKGSGFGRTDCFIPPALTNVFYAATVASILGASRLCVACS